MSSGDAATSSVHKLKRQRNFSYIFDEILNIHFLVLLYNGILYFSDRSYPGVSAEGPGVQYRLV
jgi:hypothetical protein